MNTVITSREAILEGCRKIIRQNGPAGLSIRKLAESMQISTGSIYHYFPSKTDLLESAVESVWKEIFSDYGKNLDFAQFTDCVEWIFSCLKESESRYLGFLELHSSLLQDHAADSQTEAMQASWNHLRKILRESLAQDPVYDCAGQNGQPVSEAADAVFSLILSSIYLHSIDEESVLAFVRGFILQQGL